MSDGTEHPYFRPWAPGLGARTTTALARLRSLPGGQPTPTGRPAAEPWEDAWEDWAEDDAEEPGGDEDQGEDTEELDDDELHYALLEHAGLGVDAAAFLVEHRWDIGAGEVISAVLPPPDY